MFDSTTWPEPTRSPHLRRTTLRAAFICAALSVSVAAWGAAMPARPVAVIHSPTNLRQIEVFSTSAGTTDFYLANAGFRAPHKHHLIASMDRVTGWKIKWQSDNAATIQLHPTPQKFEIHGGLGVKVTFTSS